MNEQIKKLALQAGAVNVWEWASDDVLDTKNMDAEKFAELIVRECADIGERYADGNYEVRNQILSHFGLEEE
jgi:hypothetical protein